jgi:hypothetical protein
MSELRTNPLAKDAQPGSVIEPDPKHLDALLDQAVAESFPASDPPAVSRGDHPPTRPWPAGQDLPGQSAKRCPQPTRRGHLRKVLPAAAIALVGVGVGLARLIRRRRH